VQEMERLDEGLFLPVSEKRLPALRSLFNPKFQQ